MLCVDSSRLCMSGLSLCNLCLCYSILGSQFSNKYLLMYRLGGLFHAQEARTLKVERCMNDIVLRDTESPEELFVGCRCGGARYRSTCLRPPKLTGT